MIICSLINLYIMDGILINSFVIGWRIFVFCCGEILVIKIVVLIVNGVVIKVERIVIKNDLIIIGSVFIVGCLFVLIVLGFYCVLFRNCYRLM